MKCARSADGLKKHPCPDCTFCQWCADTRCNLCLREQRMCRMAAAENKRTTKKKSKTVIKKSKK